MVFKQKLLMSAIAPVLLQQQTCWLTLTLHFRHIQTSKERGVMFDMTFFWIIPSLLPKKNCFPWHEHTRWHLIQICLLNKCSKHPIQNTKRQLANCYIMRAHCLTFIAKGEPPSQAFLYQRLRLGSYFCTLCLRALIFNLSYRCFM